MAAGVDLFDIVAKEYVTKNVNGIKEIMIPADQSRIIVELPAGTKLEKDGNHIITANKQTLSYK